MSTSRLRRSIASLDAFECTNIEADSRDAAALALALRGTLGEARAGQMSWSDREALMGWLHKNRKSIPVPCVALCGQLEIRLGFSFLPGLSWPGQQQPQPQPQPQRHHHRETAAAAASATGGAGGQGTSAPVVVRRRNLAGLPPPVGKNAAEAAEADAAAAAAMMAAAGGAGAAGVSTSSSYVSPDSTKRGKGMLAPGGGGGRGAMEDGNYSSTDDEAGAGVIGLGGAPRELFSSGLGSPETLPSVLEHGGAAVGMSSPDEADDTFVLQPTPRGVKSYCIIQRTRSTIRTYFRLFLQEQRRIPAGDRNDASASPTIATTAGLSTTTATAAGGSTSAAGASSNVSSSAGLAGGGGGGGGGDGGATASEASSGGGGMETLRAFLAVGGGGGAGGGADGGIGGGRFLLSSKRYRSTKPRSGSHVWSTNGVWKDKHALAKVATSPWGGKGEGTMNSPSLLGAHARVAAAAAAAATTASPVSPVSANAFPASIGSGSGTGSAGGSAGGTVAGSPGDGGSGGNSKAQSPALSGSSGGGGGGSGSGGGSAGRFERGDGSGGGSGSGSSSSTSYNPACWAVVVNVQSEGEGKLLSVAAIVPDPGSAGGGGGGGEQSVAAASLAEGLRKWEKTGTVPPGTVVLRSKQPKWSAWQGCHTLAFERGGERVREPSRKNVSMVAVDAAPACSGGGGGGGGNQRKGSAASGRGKGGGSSNNTGDAQQRGEGLEGRRPLPPASRPTLQLGKISEDHFSLDFGYPLSPLQAFVAAMSIFDG